MQRSRAGYLERCTAVWVVRCSVGSTGVKARVRTSEQHLLLHQLDRQWSEQGIRLSCHVFLTLCAACCAVDSCVCVCALQKSNSKYGNEHEAVAVYSMMRGVEKFCPIYTLCIGNAFGEAALLLAAGTKVGGEV